MCFCLTKFKCEEMAKSLHANGIMAEVVTGHTNFIRATAGTLRRFSAGGVQVICANKGALRLILYAFKHGVASLLACSHSACLTLGNVALGRGFHELDIRFVFHAVIPTSLRDYIQETGRGGRDNKPSYCVLFFSHHDRHVAEGVMGLSRAGKYGRKLLQGEARTTAARDLDLVISYAATGDKCRYSMLAECGTLEEAGLWSQTCKHTSKCDNCQAWETDSVDLDEGLQRFFEQPRTLLSTGGSSSPQFSYCKREVTSVIADCLSQVLDQARRRSHTTDTEAETCMREIIGERFEQETCEETKMLLFNLLKTENAKNDKSLVTDLLRFLHTKNNEQQKITDWSRWESVLKRKTKFYIQNVKLLHTISTKSSVVLDVEQGMPSSATLSSCGRHRNLTEATISLSEVYRGMPDPWRQAAWVGCVPFVMQYEICR